MKKINSEIKVNIDKNYYSKNRNEMLQHIPKSSKKILDVGCGEGVFGSKLKILLNAEVWGVEICIKAAKKAEKKLFKVVIGDIAKKLKSLPVNYYDCIVFNDVLEHLVDPYKLLKEIKVHLNEDGVIVTSIPNIRYFTVMYDLVFKAEWNYTEYGVLDKTHLRFFTKKSIIEMFKNLDYTILKVIGINESTSWKVKLVDMLLFKKFHDATFLQFVCIVKPK